MSTPPAVAGYPAEGKSEQGDGQDPGGKRAGVDGPEGQGGAHVLPSCRAAAWACAGLVMPAACIYCVSKNLPCSQIVAVSRSRACRPCWKFRRFSNTKLSESSAGS